jgi:hypothetical protein
MGRVVARRGGNSHVIFRRNLEERPKLRWKITIKINLKEIERKVLDRTYLTQDSDKWPNFMNTAIKPFVS